MSTISRFSITSDAVIRRSDRSLWRRSNDVLTKRVWILQRRGTHQFVIVERLNDWQPFGTGRVIHGR